MLEGVFRHWLRRRKSSEQRFYFTSERRRWWHKRDLDDFDDDPPSAGEEQLWRVAWWRNGWGVWPGDADPITTPPTYTTVNIPQIDSATAGCWAVGVVPPHPRTRVRCAHRGDPTAPFM
ncbi:hypothetical protein [Nonomuraea sp. NPDC050643]|uniref:hypothetical protein n=1 Tax=Nonomuraea sp. NPDC050643 TaxID=3155660 RepID=UPI0033EE4610